MNIGHTQDRLEGWTKSEKYDLLQSLKATGSHDIEAIHRFIPGKTHDQIQEAINFYKKKAFINPSYVDRRKRKYKVDSSAKSILPIAHWAKILTDNFNYEDLQTETAAALRLIAEFEDIPAAVCTENINFKQAYRQLANALEGKALEKDRHFVVLLNKCVLDTALTCKAFIRLPTLKHVIRNIDMSAKAKQFPKPTEDNQEFSSVMQLVLQRNYNPFNLSDEYLKAD